MKNGFVFLFLMVALFACKPQEHEMVTMPWEGKWNLVYNSHGWASGETYSKGDVVWTFHANHDVDVNMNIGLLNVYLPINSSGTYNCPINNGTITIGSAVYDFSVNNDGKLYMTENQGNYPRSYIFERD